METSTNHATRDRSVCVFQSEILPDLRTALTRNACRDSHSTDLRSAGTQAASHSGVCVLHTRTLSEVLRRFS